MFCKTDHRIDQFCQNFTQNYPEQAVLTKQLPEQKCSTELINIAQRLQKLTETDLQDKLSPCSAPNKW